jgi:hypothetical protein
LCGNVVAYDSNLVVEKLLEVETKLHASRSMMHDTLPNPRLRLHPFSSSPADSLNDV